MSRVTTLQVRAASAPLHPSRLTRTLCLAFAYHSLCQVQYTFNSAHAFNQPLEAWNVSRVTTLHVRAASRPLLPSPLTRTLCLAFAYHSLCRVQSTFAGAYAFNQNLEAWDVSRVTRQDGFTVRAASRPLSRITATASHHHASSLSPSSSPIGSSPPISHTPSPSPPSDSTGRRSRSKTPL